MSFNDQQIEKIVNQYKKQREREKIYYEAKKADEQFVIKNRERAKSHYDLNKDRKKEQYEANKEFRKCKALYYYYKKNDNLEKFKENGEKVKILNEGGFFF